MVRIEKSQINLSAFVILSSTLEKVQSDRIIEIVNDGKAVVIRPKEEHEKDDFSIDLDFLKTLFNALVTGDPRPIIVGGKAEQYLRNCSYACYYYRNENVRLGAFDHFDLFHHIHFGDITALNIDDDIIKTLCGLFRVDYKLCLPFIECINEIDETIALPQENIFNQIFETIIISRKDNLIEITFQSKPLEMKYSLDSLFAIKDLLSCRGIDTKAIPEYNTFSIQLDEEVNYHFITMNGQKIAISFKYDRLIVNIKKNCA